MTLGLRTRFAIGISIAGLLTVLLPMAPGFSEAGKGLLTRISVADRGEEGTKDSGSRDSAISLSADGRYIPYSSQARNLVAGDTNGREDVFVYDSQQHHTIRISMSNKDMELEGDSSAPSISADGRYVAYVSSARTIILDDTNDQPDIFVWDRQTKKAVRVNVSSAGVQANGQSSSPALSADGRYVTFISEATNLVPMDVNNLPDVFIRDLQTNTTTRVNVSATDIQANKPTTGPLAISPNGQFVAFVSEATNLAPNDTNNKADLFVRDLRAHTTTRISPYKGNAQPPGRSYDPAFSADGRYLTFTTEVVDGNTPRGADVCVFDRQTGNADMVSTGPGGAPSNGASHHPTISADGRYVAFLSSASNLVANDTNRMADVFLADRKTRVITRISVSTTGAQADGDSACPVISANGRYIAFLTAATNLRREDTNEAWDVYLYDRGPDGAVPVQLPPDPGPLKPTPTPTTPPTPPIPELPALERASVGDDGAQGNDASAMSAISQDGRYVAFVSNAVNLVSGDTNRNSDVFVRDMVDHHTVRASVANNGTQGNWASGNSGIALSANGRYVAFASAATNLLPSDFKNSTDIFVRDLVKQSTVCASMSSGGVQANGDCRAPSISADGRYVVFASTATNLVYNDSNGQRDIFLRDLHDGVTTRLSVNTAGQQGDNWSDTPVISADGHFVAYASAATNLAPGDTNNMADIFVYEIATKTTTRVSQSRDRQQGNGNSTQPSISADGRFITFQSQADNLTPGDTNRIADIFVVDRTNGAIDMISTNTRNAPGNGVSAYPAISGDGRYVAFISQAADLLAKGTGHLIDLYVRDRTTGVTTCLSTGPKGGIDLFIPAISADGRDVVASTVTPLLPEDTNNKLDVYLFRWRR